MPRPLPSFILHRKEDILQMNLKSRKKERKKKQNLKLNVTKASTLLVELAHSEMKEKKKNQENILYKKSKKQPQNHMAYCDQLQCPTGSPES